MSNKRRILLISPGFGTAAQVWMYRQATMIDEVELNVACVKRENIENYRFLKNGLSYWESLSKVPLENVRHPKRFFKKAKRAIWTSARFARNMHFQRALTQVVSNNDFSGILYHYGTSATRFFPAIKQFNLPFAIHFNGFDLSEQMMDAAYRRDLAELIPHTSTLVVVADYMAEELIKLGADQAKIQKIPYGVPIGGYTPSDKTADAHCRFLSVGRLTLKKAPLLSIEAFARCKKAYADCSYTIIGDGPLMPDCVKLADELGVADSIEFMGARSSAEVQQAMASSSVFLQHSVTSEKNDKEGWPVAIGEAAASGLPIVSTIHASIPEQVVDGKSGLLVAENDLDGMANGMIQMAQTPEMRKSFGDHARAHISQWDLPLQIKKLERVLVSLDFQNNPPSS